MPNSLKVSLKKLLGKDLEKAVKKLSEILNKESEVFDEFILQESKLKSDGE